MLFNSYIYILFFLPIVGNIYYLIKARHQLKLSYYWLIFVSLFFYAWWKSEYIMIILTSIGVNYFVSQSFNSNYLKEKNALPRKLLLAVAIVFNLGLLGYFKYKYFILENVNGLIGSALPNPTIVLPLAISFFTFQQISFLVDTYKKIVKNHNFTSYILYITFFPQLIAGPIVHHKEMMPQFAKTEHNIPWVMISQGLFLFSIGLFKKVEIADYFAHFATFGFNHSAGISMINAWVSTLSYCFQIYFDFSGYTDMALGSALLFGIRLPYNFNSPYKALSIQDFWQRWHMTLSRFLRDYVYIPLGGNRISFHRTLFNVFLTFIIGGLWHGAAWTFVGWGVMHGVGVSVQRIWAKFNISMPFIMGWMLTFLFINLTWVMFRANNIEQAVNMYQGLIGYSGIGLQGVSAIEFFIWNFSLQSMTFIGQGVPVEATFPIALLPVLMVIVFCKNSNQYLEYFRPSIFKLIISVILMVISLYDLSNYSEFLYFQF